MRCQSDRIAPRMENPTPATRIAMNPASSSRIAFGAMGLFEMVTSAVKAVIRGLLYCAMIVRDEVGTTAGSLVETLAQCQFSGYLRDDARAEIIGPGPRNL